jgi:ribosomal protein S18 acetylase RimI-like enzyme
MPSFSIRPFRRDDRDQLTLLVNGHAAAVVPGASMSVNTVLSQLEREPGDFIIDPWVAERRALVAEQAGVIVAAALLVRYRDGEDVGSSFRAAGEIRWLLFWPMAPDDNPYWNSGHEAADALMGRAIAQLDEWQVTSRQAGGSLPHPGIYGVPEQWPHIERLFERHGFEQHGPTELVLMADLDRFEPPGEPPVPGLTVRRLVGMIGTRLTANVGGDPVAHIEVDHLDQPERRSRSGGLADIGNLFVGDEHRRRGVGSWLLRQAAQWLRLGHVDRLLAYAWPEEADQLAFLAHHGFVELTTTRKGWLRQPVAITAGEHE